MNIGCFDAGNASLKSRSQTFDRYLLIVILIGFVEGAIESGSSKRSFIMIRRLEQYSLWLFSFRL